jgi:ParB-like chromosome segregation protein Spo0J
MPRRPTRALLAALLLVLCLVAATVPADDLKTVDSFRDAADKAKALLTLPDWEQTPEAVEAATKKAIENATCSGKVSP